jgi:hypothetical protein
MIKSAATFRIPILFTLKSSKNVVPSLFLKYNTCVNNNTIFFYIFAIIVAELCSQLINFLSDICINTNLNIL